MKKKIGILIIILISALLIIGSIYAYEQSNSMILQGEVEVKTLDLSSKLSARVNKINVQKGDIVKKGDVLIELDTPEVDAKAQQSNAMLELALAQQQKVNNGARQEQIAMAKAKYDVALKTYNRMKRLHSEGVIPTQKLDEATAYYNASKEQYEMLQNGARIEDKMSASAGVHRAKGANAEVNAYLKENKIIAPSDGTITDISVEVGELAPAGYPLVTLIDNNDCWVTFNIREDLLPKIKIGTEIDVQIPAVGKDTVKVRVNYISALGNFATWRATKVKGDFDLKTFEVRAVPVGQISDLRAGMSVVFDWNKLK